MRQTRKQSLKNTSIKKKRNHRRTSKRKIMGGNEMDGDKQRLFNAIFNSKTDEVIKIITETPVLLNRPINHQSTILHLAVMFENETVLNHLLRTPGIVINVKGEQGGTPLHFATESKPKMAMILMENGADIHARDSHNNTPLHWAFKDAIPNIPVIETLLDMGAEVDAKNMFGTTPLHSACKKGHYDIAMILMDRGANVHHKDNDGRTPFHFACESGNKKLVDFLIDKKGADVHEKDGKGMTPLYYALYKDRLDVAKILLGMGANVNERDNTGRTPLHLSSRNKYKEVVKFLIENGADVNAVDVDGQTPLHHTCNDPTSTESSITLLENGANIHVTNIHGNTPLDLACMNSGDEKLITLLIEKGAYPERCSKKIITLYNKIWLNYDRKRNKLLEFAHNEDDNSFDETELKELIYKNQLNYNEELLFKLIDNLIVLNKQNMLRFVLNIVNESIPIATIVDKTGKTIMHHIASLGNNANMLRSYKDIVDNTTRGGSKVAGG